MESDKEGSWKVSLEGQTRDLKFLLSTCTPLSVRTVISYGCAKVLKLHTHRWTVRAEWHRQSTRPLIQRASAEWHLTPDQVLRVTHVVGHTVYGSHVLRHQNLNTDSVRFSLVEAPLFKSVKARPSQP